MATTYTASDQLATPRQTETGINVARGVLSSTTVTLSVSDQILACKVPHGAVIINGYISGTVDNATTTIKIGVIGAGGTLVDTNLMSSASLSATSQLTRFNAGSLPVTVSLSDDRTPRFAWVTATVIAAASITVCYSVTVVVEYCMPGAI